MAVRTVAPRPGPPPNFRTFHLFLCLVKPFCYHTCAYFQAVTHTGLWIPLCSTHAFFITYWLIWISYLRTSTHRLFWRHAWHLRFICILHYSMTRYFGNACLIIILHLSERTRICLYSQPRIIICCYLLAVGTFITRFLCTRYSRE